MSFAKKIRNTSQDRTGIVEPWILIEKSLVDAPEGRQTTQEEGEKHRNGQRPPKREKSER